MNTAVTPRRLLARAGMVLLLAGIVIAMLPWLATPAAAASQSPEVECGDLIYLNKFEFSSGGSGSFAQGSTSSDADGSADGYQYTDGDVTVAYTVDDGNETHAVTWWTTTPLDLVVLKAGGDTPSVGTVYEEEMGPIIETVVGNAFSHITFCYDIQPTVVVSTACEGTQPTATVTIDNDGDEEFSVEVFIDDVSQGTITETTSYDGDADSVLRAEWGDGESAEATFEDCSVPEPTVELSTACDATQATATVTIDNDGDEEFSVEVFIDDVSQGTITETTSYDGDADSVLRAEWGDGESAEATFEDCSEDEPGVSTASFTVGSECQTDLPALTYEATVNEDADDPIGDITLTVSDAGGQLGQATFSASEAGSLVLPTDLEGATVAVSWDFDDTTLEQTLADGCAAVLGAVDEREDEPLPATDVEGEQLPNAGFQEDLLLLLGGGFLALGCSLLLYGRRRYGVIA